MKLNVLINERIKKYTEDKSVLSVLVSGEIDDLDKNEEKTVFVFIVFESQISKEKEIEYVDDIELNFVYISVYELINIIEIRDNILVDLLLKANILYERSKYIQGILDRNKEVYNEMKSVGYNYNIDLIRFKLTNELTRVLEIKDDNNLLCEINLFTFILARTYYILNSLWIIKYDKMLEYIKNNDEKLYNYILEINSKNDVKIKLDLLNKAVDYILEPFGGRLNKLEKTSNFRIKEMDT